MKMGLDTSLMPSDLPAVELTLPETTLSSILHSKFMISSLDYCFLFAWGGRKNVSDPSGYRPTMEKMMVNTLETCVGKVKLAICIVGLSGCGGAPSDHSSDSVSRLDIPNVTGAFIVSNSAKVTQLENKVGHKWLGSFDIPGDRGEVKNRVCYEISAVDVIEISSRELSAVVSRGFEFYFSTLVEAPSIDVSSEQVVCSSGKGLLASSEVAETDLQIVGSELLEYANLTSGTFYAVERIFDVNEVGSFEQSNTDGRWLIRILDD